MSHSDFQRLSDFATALSLENVEQSVINRTKLVILDSITAIVHGNRTKEPARFQDYFSTTSAHTFSSSSSSILGTSYKNHMAFTAFMNGIGMVSEELDEGNPIAKGHPSCHFFPAILSAAEALQLDGRSLLESFITGYEIGARAGASIQLKPSVHPHGNWGMIGAAFAVGKVFGFTAEQYQTALSLGAMLPFPSLWEPVLEGHRIRDVYIGLNNLNTLLLPDLIKAGYSGSLQSIGPMYSEVIGERFQASELTKDIGKQYLIMETYFKFYAYCRFCHSPIDAMIELMQEVQIQAGDITKISVYTYSLAAKLNGQLMNNEFAGKFSIPHSLAQTILGTDCNPNQLRDLAQHIDVYEDKEYTKLLPGQRNARVEVLLENGKQLQKEVVGASGDARTEGLEVKVMDKCRKLLTEVIGSDKTDRLIKQVMDLEHVANVKELVENVTT
jgi:2-methylcitrate dehydratase PrpD